MIGYEVSNPAALGWEWSAESGTRFQIVKLRGVYGPPMFAIRTKTADRWSSPMPMAEKWACEGTRKAFLTAIKAFQESANS